MNTALESLKEYCIRKGYDPDEDLYEILQEGNVVHFEVYDSRRWWNDTENVTEIEGKLYRWYGAETTGDDSPRDVGWEFNSDYIHLVEKVTELREVTFYKPIE